MFEWHEYMSLVQLLNPKVRYMGNEKSLLALDTLRDICTGNHNIKLYRGRQEDQYQIYHVLEFLVADKVLARNPHGIGGILNMMLLYCVVHVMGQQMELADVGDKSCKVNVQHIKITYPGDELINCLPDEKAFGHVTKYYVHPKLVEDLHWSLNPNILSQTTQQDLPAQHIKVIGLLNVWSTCHNTKVICWNR